MIKISRIKKMKIGEKIWGINGHPGDVGCIRVFTKAKTNVLKSCLHGRQIVKIISEINKPNLRNFYATEVEVRCEIIRRLQERIKKERQIINTLKEIEALKKPIEERLIELEK